MKATITDVPQPKPPRVVTLEMTEAEARELAAICNWDAAIPDALVAFGFTDAAVTRVLNRVSDALRKAGVRDPGPF